MAATYLKTRWLCPPTTPRKHDKKNNKPTTSHQDVGADLRGRCQVRVEMKRIAGEDTAAGCNTERLWQ